MAIVTKLAPDSNPHKDYKTAETVIDKLILIAPDYDYFTIYDLICKADISDQERQTASDNDAVELMFSDLKYIWQQGNGFMFQLTDLGRSVKRAGGHYKYVKKQKQEEQEEIEFKRKQFQLTEAQLQEIKDAKARSLLAEETSRIANRNSRTANFISILSVLITVLIALSTCRQQ